MTHILKLGCAAAILGLLASACGASQGNGAPAETERHQASNSQGNKVNDNNNVPVNQRFGTLDEYLAYLEKTSAPVDGPWYKQVGPDQYQLQTGNLRVLGADNAEEKRIFTRQELEKKFGFSK